MKTGCESNSRQVPRDPNDLIFRTIHYIRQFIYRKYKFMIGLRIFYDLKDYWLRSQQAGMLGC